MTKEKDILLNVLNSKTPNLDLLKLDEQGILELLLPELTALKGVDIVNGQKHKDNFIHTLQVVKQTSEVTNDIWLILVAILHDIGKAPTKRFIKDLGWTFHHHEQKSADMLEAIFNRFELDKSNFKRVYEVIKWHGHMKHLTENSNDASLRRFDKDINEYLEDVVLFSKCDITTRFADKRKMFCDNVDTIYKKILVIREEDKVREYQIPVTGAVIMKDFNIKPSKFLGDIKTAAKDAVIKGDIEGDYDSVYKYIKNWINENSK